MAPITRFTSADRASKGLAEGLPKRALSGYLLFAKENHSKVVASNPHSDPQDIFRKVGKAWNELADSEKDKWNRLAADLRKKAAMGEKSRSRSR
ncbi:HMG (high mobility group) box domain-containing protein [Ditylenchus destructor]|uniref:HMG (High mobility group) box domain-containing protein n=1 Tax=Ditylenchus destructor TaxID=166010 RepID=A0AAD4MKJ7_9BILA|nr:HMG (high mobility group) box domain-containing protein [Ditylenchus destructor]